MIEIPSKQERHAIYKEAAKIFGGLNGMSAIGLCYCICNADERKARVFIHLKECFPELYAQMPPGAKEGERWWQANKAGYQARLKAINRCIELTSDAEEPTNTTKQWQRKKMIQRSRLK